MSEKFLPDLPFKPVFKAGNVWLVGAGPGDPSLLTIAAYKAIQEADIIVYDALVSEEILKLAPSKAKLHFAGKRGGKPSTNQLDISQKLIDWAKQGNKVLRLKGGDPLIFARGGEELLTLAKARIHFYIIPGVTAALAAAAAMPIPLTIREENSSVTFVTGHILSKELEMLLKNFAAGLAPPVMVIYMGLQNLPAILHCLVQSGYSKHHPIAIIGHASNHNQKILVINIEDFLNDCSGHMLTLIPPAIIILGPVVQYYKELSHYLLT
jgi:uroporphyrin-III C-methyltransferase